MDAKRSATPSGGTIRLRLRAAIADAQPLYVLPREPVASAVLIPALRASTAVEVMMGYFASGALADIAPGLATFLRCSTAPLRIVISPFLQPRDFDTLTKDRETLIRYAERILVDNVPDEEALARHTLECLAWLIARDRLVISIAVMRDAMFHPKVWLFRDDFDEAALHGSSNLTKNGLSRNLEQLTLSRSWSGPDAQFHIAKLQSEFDRLWDGGDDDCRVIALPEAVQQRIVTRHKGKDMPDEEIATRHWRRARGRAAVEGDDESSIRLTIPGRLNYETGAFAHQGSAVQAWLAQERRGIMEVATGAGKTVAAMIGATRVQDDVGALLIVVAAPYRPLIEQWCDEVAAFGVSPVSLSALGGASERKRAIAEAGRRLSLALSRAEVLVVSNDTLCTPEFAQSLAAVKSRKLLVADECHNLGAPSFVADPPHVFDYRLGLSATPIRQYDAEGTEALFEYFGGICYSFTLEQAVGTCLTPYDYHVHPVELNCQEMETWRELTDEIGRNYWKVEAGIDDARLKYLYRQRRLVLETAAGKLSTLSQLLDAVDGRDLRYALIYATDKDPEQLVHVNRILLDRDILFHQLTQQETSSRAKTREILDAFQAGDLQVLTAKRVLDEGVNIPQVKLAYVLASTTVRRQWVQRRGRLLRKCEPIGKTHAVIHDFVVLPVGASDAVVDSVDPEARRLVRSELERVWEFARLSRNGPLDGGPYETVRRLQELSNERVMD